MAEKLGGDPIEAFGRQPAFFDDPAIDRLMHMFLALAEEVAVTTERLETHEKLLIAKGLISEDDFATYEPSAEEKRARVAQHKAFVARLLDVVQQEINKAR